MPKMIIEIEPGDSDRVLAGLKSQLGLVDGQIQVLAESSKKLQKQQAAAEKEFRSVAASLDPVIRAQQQYDRTVRALDEALKRGINKSLPEHNRLLAIAKTRYNEASNASVSFGQRAEKSLGGLLTNLGKVQFLIGGLGMLATGLGLGAAIEEAREAEREISLLEAQIKNLPTTSSITADLVQQHAREIGEAFAFDGEEVTRAERALIRFGVTSDSVLQSATQLSADVARTLGIGLTEAAQMLGKALQQPGEGMKALKAAGLALSENQIALAQNLAETGRQADAQRVVIGSLSAEVEGTAAKFRDSFDGALAESKVAAGDLAETLGLSLLPGLTDLLNTLSDIGGSDAAVSTINNLGGALSGVLGIGSRVVVILDRISEFGSIGGLDLSDFSGLGVLSATASMAEEALDRLTGRDRELAAAAAAAAAAEEEQRHETELATASIEAQAQTLALSKKSHTEMVEISARWGKETATLVAEEDRHTKALQGLLDRADPLAKAEREAAESTAMLSSAFATGEIDATEYRDALAQVNYELAKIRANSELTANDVPLMPVDRNFFQINSVAEAIQKDIDAQPPRIDYVEVTAGAMTELEVAFDEATSNFAQNLEGGMVSAGETFLVELMNGEEDALENFGEGLKQMFIQSVAEYLSNMAMALAKELVIRLANVAKEAAMRRAANSGSGGGGGGGGTDYAGMAQSGYSAYSSGGAGMSSGAAGMGIFVVALAAIVAIFKADADRAKKRNYGTEAGISVEDGSITGYWEGKLSTTGPKVLNAMGDMVDALSEATGAWITGTHEAVIRIRNDKESFQLEINQVVVGTFATAEEAVLEAVKAMFTSGDLSRELDPMIQRVIAGFHGSDPQQLVDAVTAIQGIVDEVSGLSDIEVELRNLPQQVNALTNSLIGMGVGTYEAQELAERWKLTRLADLRDQITGHQASAAEQMAEQQRKAAFFNAEVALMQTRAEMQVAEIDMQIAALAAGGTILAATADQIEAEMALEEQRLRIENGYIGTRFDLLDADAYIFRSELELRGATITGSLKMLEQQRAILLTMIENLPELIRPDEIRLPGRAGGGGRGNVSSGPSEAEQRATAFLDFLENLRMDGMTEMERRIYELDKAFAEQAQAAGEVAGGEELLAAARAAAFAQIRADFLEGLRLEGLSEYQRGLEEINREFAEQALLDPELVGGEEELAAARAAAAAQLREDLLDSFGSPMEALRDRLADMKQKFADLTEANHQLFLDFQSGAISAQQYADAIAHGDQVVQEFILGMKSELLNLALYFTDAMGDTEASAEIRAQLAQLEWEYKKVELRMMIEMIRAAGGFGMAVAATADGIRGMFQAITDGLLGVSGALDTFPAPIGGGGNQVGGGPGQVGGGGSGGGSTNPGEWSYQDWIDWLNSLPDLFPGGTGSGDGQIGGGNSGNDELIRAHEALIDALEDLADLQRDLWASDLSPLNAEQQTQYLAGQIQDAYNQAQASQSPEDIRAFQDLIRQYLGSYQDAYGSTGGYTAEFLRINGLINSLLGMGGIGGVVPGPGMMGGPAGTGTPGWRPTPGGQGVVLPFERSGGPSSPFVVESPALTAIAALAQETNRRLAALEQRMTDVRDVTARGNEQAASRFFTAGRNTPSTVSGKPRIQRRGA